MTAKKYLTNFVSIIISISILFLSTCSYQMEVKALNTSCKYFVYNAITTKYIRDYTLEPLECENNALSMSNYNDRYIDWDKSGVVKIMTDSSYRGTGFVIDSHKIVTAAHLLCTSGTYNRIAISSIYLFDKDGNKVLEATPVEYHLPVGHMSGYYGFDYALITVKEDLSDYACFDLGVPLDSIVDNNQEIKITGFPEKYNNSTVNTHTLHNMYSGYGEIVAADDKMLQYRAITIDGDSGSPIYVETDYYGETYNTVIAIHNTSIHTGVRVTTDLLHFYYHNNNIEWQ